MATPSDELFCRARIVGDGTAPPVHSMGGVRSSFDPSSTAVALAASCLARLGYRGGNPALGFHHGTPDEHMLGAPLIRVDFSSTIWTRWSIPMSRPAC